MKLSCYSLNSYSDFNWVDMVAYLFECEARIIMIILLSLLSGSTSSEKMHHQHHQRLTTLQYELMHITSISDRNHCLSHQKTFCNGIDRVILAQNRVLISYIDPINRNHYNAEKLRNFCFLGRTAAACVTNDTYESSTLSYWITIDNIKANTIILHVQLWSSCIFVMLIIMISIETIICGWCCGYVCDTNGINGQLSQMLLTKTFILSYTDTVPNIELLFANNYTFNYYYS